MLRRGLVAGAALVAATAGASAQEPGDAQVYEPSFFARFAPQTAFDMLEQVPGFSIRTADEERGLGQGGTNVLINGERVTSKDTDVLEILQSTPVQAVQRIEVSDAASLGVTGLTGQVANIVIERNEMSGSFRYVPEFRHGSQPRLTRGSASIAGKRGDLNYTLGLSNSATRSFEQGPELVIFGDGADPEERFEKVRVFVEAPTLTTALEFPVGARSTMALRGSASAISVEQEETSIGFDDGVRISKASQDIWNANLATEFTRKGESGNVLKLIASQRLSNTPTITDIDGFTEAGILGLDATFDQEDDEGESILRSEYTWKQKNGASWELTGEVAYNFLESDTSLVVNGNLIEDNTTTVDEIRVQSSLTRKFKAGEKLALQTAVGAEWSQIEADDRDSERLDAFLRPKGFVTAAYPFSPKVDLRGKIERTVGQLDFGDFVEVRDLTEQRPRAGNVNLVPQQAWEGEVEIQRKFSKNEKIVLRLEGQLIEDLVDRIALPVENDEGEIELVDAVGNIDEATYAALTAEGTIFTQRWGFDGGRLDFRGSRQTSKLEDPITGDDRQISLVQDWTYSVNFRHDVPGTEFAWGAGVTNAARRTVFRFNEISSAETPDPDVSAFIEHKDIYGLNVIVRATNLLNQDDVRQRTIFDGPRSDGILNRIEARDRIDNPGVSISISGTF